MNVFKKLSLILGWILAGLLASIVLVYLILRIINWNDRPPSTSALKLEKAYRERPHVEDKSNGYLYFLGFSVNKNQNPMQIGRQRNAWHKTLLNNSNIKFTDDPGGEGDDFKFTRGKQLASLVETCGIMNKNCQLALEGSNEIVLQWLKSEQWILNRYRSLLAYENWLEPFPFDVRSPLLSYHHAFVGQKLLFLQAWQLAKQNDAENVRTLLTDDIQFWRHVLRETDMLITKILATAALNNHFKWSNFVTKSLSPDTMMKAIPRLWLDPISDLERSMKRCMTGEWVYMDRGVKSINIGDPNLFLSNTILTDESTMDNVFRALIAPLIQPQDLSNKLAHKFLVLVNMLDVDYKAYPEAVDRVREFESNRTGSIDLFGVAYNLIGNIVLESGDSDYTSYAVRIADLEGVRRAALLTAHLQSQNDSAVNAKRLQNSPDFHNPYTALPFELDTELKTITFQGLEPGERGLHRFYY